MRAIVLLLLCALSANVVPEAAAQPARRRAVVMPPAPPVPPTSESLIDDALKAGSIDEETALTYRVYSAFDDERLPAQYRGDDTGIVDTMVLFELRQRLDSLSPGTRQALEPFLIPPIYQESAHAPRSEGRPYGPAILCGSISDHFQWIDSSNGEVRVWWPLDLAQGDVIARRIAEEIDNVIWPKAKAVFGDRTPPSDVNETCNGGNGKLDIYLTHSKGRWEAVPYGACGPTASYVIAGDPAGGQQTVAHELAHVFQCAYKLGYTCLNRFPNHWWVEATAQWFMDETYENGQMEQRAANRFLKTTHLSLEDKKYDRQYGAYLFAQYMDKQHGGSALITQTWEQMTQTDPVTALNRVLPGGFEKVWPEFALYLWNRDPVAKFKEWDQLQEGARGSENTTPAGRLDDHFTSASSAGTSLLALPALSAVYDRFLFSTDARAVAFYNGLGFKLNKRVPNHPLTKHMIYLTEAAADASKKGATIQALIKRNGAWLAPQDWTGRDVVSMCLQDPNQRTEELVLIISNSDIDPNRLLRPESLAPHLVVTNMACSAWTGTASFVGRWKSLERLTTNWTFSATPTGVASFLGGYLYYTATASQAWMAESPPHCRVRTTSGTRTLSNVTLQPMHFVPRESTAYRKVDIIALRPSLDGFGQHCDAPPYAFLFDLMSFPEWFYDEGTWFPIDPSGTQVNGVRDVNKRTDYHGRWTWELKASP